MRWFFILSFYKLHLNYRKNALFIRSSESPAETSKVVSYVDNRLAEAATMHSFLTLPY